MSILKSSAVVITSSSLATICMMIPPLVVLEAADYSVFALVYLFYGLGNSLLLSVALESRAGGRGAEADMPHIASLDTGFRQVVAWASTWCGVVSGVTVTFLADWSMSLVAAAAVCMAVYRFANRFALLRTGAVGRVVKSDVVEVAVLLSGWALLLLGPGPSLAGTFAIWLLGGLAAFVILGVVPSFGVTEMGAWLGGRSQSIRKLLADSLPMDIALLGTPLFLFPLLGAANFGVYRAMSNIGAPVRMVLSPLRPLFSRIDVTRVGVIAVVVPVLGIALSGACFLLLGIAAAGDVGVLSDVAQHNVPVSLYVGSLFLVHSCYQWLRSMHYVRVLPLGRVVQSLCTVLGPLLGYSLAGLSGCLWGNAVGMLASGLVWYLAAVSKLRTRR